MIDTASPFFSCKQAAAELKALATGTQALMYVAPASALSAAVALMLTAAADDAFCDLAKVACIAVVTLLTAFVCFAKPASRARDSASITARFGVEGGRSVLLLQVVDLLLLVYLLLLKCLYVLSH